MADMSTPMTIRNTAWRWQAARLFTPLALIALWEYATRTGTISTFMLPALEDVAERIWENITTGEFPINCAVTLVRTFVGF